RPPRAPLLPSTTLFRSDEAADAASAVHRIAMARPDVIVLDVAMPGMTGVELCARLKGSPETSDIPIVLLTGSGVANELIASEVRSEEHTSELQSRFDVV